MDDPARPATHLSWIATEVHGRRRGRGRPAPQPLQSPPQQPPAAAAGKAQLLGPGGPWAAMRTGSGLGRRPLSHLARFCDSASMPGLRYLSEPRRPLHERLLWLAGIAAAVCTCGYLVAQTVARWRQSPVIVAMSERQRSVWQIPFPAVTICPMSKVRAQAFNYTEVYLRNASGTASPDELRRLQLLSLQCADSRSPAPARSDDVLDLMEACALHVNDTVEFVSFRGREYPPGENGLFRPLLTDEGVCYSFNMLPAGRLFPPDTVHWARGYLRYGPGRPVQWSPDGGYEPEANTGAYPFRALQAGLDGGLMLLLLVNSSDIDHLCSLSMQGFKVQLHSPADFPRVARRAFLAAADSAVHVSLYPHEMRTDPGLRERYSAGQRQCYFSGERPLRYFRRYTQSNCQLECLANATLRRCGCVEFHMPRDFNASICERPSRCAENAAWLMQTLEAGLEDHRDTRPGPAAAAALAAAKADKAAPASRPCGCLPACTSVAYSIERSTARLDIAKYTRLARNDRELDTYTGTILHIYFRDTNFIPSRRMELYGVVDMIASCGGLLGLCLGASVLSVLELLYWALVRPWAGLRPPSAAAPARVRPQPSAFLP